MTVNVLGDNDITLANIQVYNRLPVTQIARDHAHFLLGINILYLELFLSWSVGLLVSWSVVDESEMASEGRKRREGERGRKIERERQKGRKSV